MPDQLRSRRVIIRGRRGGVMNRRGFVAGLGSFALRWFAGRNFRPAGHTSLCHRGTHC